MRREPAQLKSLRSPKGNARAGRVQAHSTSFKRLSVVIVGSTALLLGFTGVGFANEIGNIDNAGASATVHVGVRRCPLLMPCAGPAERLTSTYEKSVDTASSRH